MDNLLKDMGKRIFDRRKQLNMTHRTLAEWLMSHPRPSPPQNWGKGYAAENNPQVCDALHISTEYLLRGVIKKRFFSSYEEDFPLTPNNTGILKIF